MTTTAELRAIENLRQIKDTAELVAHLVRIRDLDRAAEMVCCLVRQGALLHADLMHV